jgi:hypothetical protein
VTNRRRASALAAAALVVLALGVAGPPAAPLGLTGSVVFEHDPGRGSDLYLWVAASPRTAVPLVATHETEFDPALARDGRVVFARSRGTGSELFLYESGEVTQLTRDGGIAQHPAWSVGGDRIVYASDMGEGAEIMELFVDRPSPRPVAPADGEDLTPSYAPDGRIAFVSNRSGTFDLYVVTPSGSVTRMTRGREVELSPVWSPDGSQIAFARVAARGNADIWLLTVATGELTRLTAHAADDSSPSFSPAGDRIAFVSDRAGPPSIWTIPARAHAKATRLVRIPGVSLGPAWGPSAPRARGMRAVTGRAALTITCPSNGPYAGSAGADDIRGTGANDTICGRGGNDRLRGRDGNDSLAGGSGNDRVFGQGQGDPIVSGGAGRDFLYGGPGDDKLFARDGTADSLHGGPGFDRAQSDGNALDANVRVNGVRTIEGVIG